MILNLSCYLPWRRPYDHYNVDDANIIIFDEWFDFAKVQSKRFRRTAVNEGEVLLHYADTIQARGCNSIWESSVPMEAEHLAERTRNFLHFLDDESAEATMDIRLFYAACFPSHGRRLGITKRGYLCLIPQGARQGDLVCIPHGNRVPLILREAGGHFRNIGEAYVNGLMRGEAAALEGCEELVFRIF